MILEGKVLSLNPALKKNKNHTKYTLLKLYIC